jgi:hypothetical protein
MVNNIKDLGNAELFVRKGKLKINPRKILVKISLPLLFNGDEEYAPVEDRQWNYDGSISDAFKLFQKNYAKTAVSANVQRFTISVTKYTVRNYRDTSVNLLDWKRGHYIYDAHGHRTDKEEPGKWLQHYGLNMKKLITPEEIAALETQKTPKEWCRFLRTIRKRVTRMIFAGELKALNKCDRLKTHVDHDKVFQEMIEKLQTLEQAVIGFRGMANDLSAVLEPMVKVQPYDSWRWSLDRVGSNIESILDNIESLKGREE